MKLSLGARLGLSYLVVILIGMGIAAPLAWLAVERLYQRTQSESLLAQAQLVASALASEPPLETSAGAYSQSSNVQPGIHTRLIDAQGGVVIDLAGSSAQPGSAGLLLPRLAQNATNDVTPQELLGRPEIAQALAGQPATAIRRVETAGGRQVLYAAAPVIAVDGTVAQIVYLATPLPDTQLSALPDALRWQLGGAILLAVVLSGIAGLLLARRIAGPLGRLARAANAVAGGDLSQQVPEDMAITELGVLGRAFNTMTKSLRQADQAKTAFVSDVSHELRTPLTVIRGTIETLQDGALDDMEARGPFLEAMNRETERLIRLVNDLLVLTRADADALNLQLEPVDIEELAHSRCEYFGPVAAQRQVSLRVTPGPQAGDAHAFLAQADADRIAQVLDNLLDNAIRYSPSGGEVRVSLERDGGEIACHVSDAGAGIPASHLPFIFERFYRADAARGRSEGGSGLGLAIVRSLVAAHGGRVAALSSEGQGTTISFWLKSVQN